MKLKRRTWRILAAAGLVLALAACEKNAMEKAGKAVDRAGEKVGDKIRDISK
jgi:predicted small secreted protein